jgi:hypothetical protein
MTFSPYLVQPGQSHQAVSNVVREGTPRDGQTMGRIGHGAVVKERAAGKPRGIAVKSRRSTW